MNTLGPIS